MLLPKGWKLTASLLVSFTMKHFPLEFSPSIFTDSWKWNRKEGGIINIFNTGDISFKHRENTLWKYHTINPDHSSFLIAFSDSFVSLATSPFALPVQRDPQAQKLKNKNMTLSVPQKRIRLRKNNWHMGREHASREKKCTMVIFLIFVQINIYIKGFQKMKIRPWKGFEKMRFLCFHIKGV